VAGYIGTHPEKAMRYTEILFENQRAQHQIETAAA
jgi:hypothetical protein